MQEKVLSLDKVSTITMGGRGPCPPLWFTKKTFLEHHVTTKKPTMMQKGIITFSPTYLPKVTYSSSILKFLNTKIIVIQVFNTRFNIQSLQL